jgi:hypothetical protein
MIGHGVVMKIRALILYGFISGSLIKRNINVKLNRFYKREKFICLPAEDY